MPRLDDLWIPKNAKFYKLKQGIGALSSDTFDNVLKKIRNGSRPYYIVNKNQEEFEDDNELKYKLTSKVFKVKQEVQFLNISTRGGCLYDEVYAFFLMFEVGEYVVIFKKNIPNIESILLIDLELVNYEDMLKVMGEKALIKSISIRNMTVSNEAILGKSYKSAGDLKGLISPMTSGKAIPGSFRFLEDRVSSSITASTGRISETASYGNHQVLFEWIKTQVYLLETNQGNDFFNRFAIPMSFNKVIESKIPIAIMIEVQELVNLIKHDDLKIMFKNDIKPICDGTRNLLFSLLETIYILKEQYSLISTGREYSCIYNSNNMKKGMLIVNEKSFSFQLNIFNLFVVKDRTGSKSTLQSLLVKKKLFSVAFNDFQYMYYKGQCFKEESTVSGVDQLLELFKVIRSFTTVTSEKGIFMPTMTRFLCNSMFDAVEVLHNKDKYVFCNDLGTEWADHITFKDKTITFIHSKHGKISNSASNLHDVVGQAIKNLGNMFMTGHMFEEKLNSFEENYNGSFKYKKKTISVSTQIARIRKGGHLRNNRYILDISGKKSIENIINDNLTQRICVLSCSFLSYKNLNDEFSLLKINKQNKGYIHQLFWILSSFEHSCREAGVIPKIYCQP